MNNKRLAQGYQPNFDIDAEVGRQGELICYNIIKGITTGSVEVKTDEKALVTGRIFIEHECRGKPSGIQTTKAEIWAYVVGAVVIAAPVRNWRIIHAHGVKRKWVREMNRGSCPSKGVTIPIQFLIQWLNELNK